MSEELIKQLQEQANAERQREADARALQAAIRRAEEGDSNVRYCGERGEEMSNQQWAENIAKYLVAVRDVPEWWVRFQGLQPDQDDLSWTVALDIYRMCSEGKIDEATKRLDQCDAIGQSRARTGITFALKQTLPDAIARDPIPPQVSPQAQFYLFAFQLLGIGTPLPLPRTNWHLKEGQDGYDDPYLSGTDYQTLCNIVCERVPGVTIQSWRESTLGQRIALLEAAIQRDESLNRDNQPDEMSVSRRLYIDDIDSFKEVLKVPPDAVSKLLKDGKIDIAENSVKVAIEDILDVPFRRNDRPDELDDVYTANVVVRGKRRATAFMLKGPGIKKSEMTIAHCGKNGDQLVKLFDAPADLFVVQFVGRIAEAVIKDVEGKVDALCKRGKQVHYVIIDGQDTARLLVAYKKLAVN